MAVLASTPRVTPPPVRSVHLRLAPGGAATLAEVLDTAWAGLGAEAAVACPVCDGRMEPRLAATGVIGGRCRACGTELD